MNLSNSKGYFFALLFFVPLLALSQSLPIPRNVLEAYEKGTRTFDGSPGPNYWQNRSDYYIEASFDPSSRKIMGKEKIVYYNESPDTLKELVIKLLQNIFQKGSPREFPVFKDDVHDGVKLTRFEINNKNYDLKNRTNVYDLRTNLIVGLDSTDFIAPKNKCTLEIDWEVTIPKFSNIRMGTYDSTSFFIAYWYPQIAVYDDVYGWDRIPYTGTVEFYNDFNNYDVKLTVPKNFIVWATGELQNPEKVFSNDLLQKYRLALQSDSIIKLITLEDLEQNKLNTVDEPAVSYHYKANYVPDFAFALSDHYLWDGSSLVVDKQTGRRTFISAAYKKESKDFIDVAEIARKVIEYFSFEFPQVPYPYPRMTVFNGQGGMEFPMMVNDGSTRSYAAALGLTSHEIAHTYFPFFMGINEKRFAWMDEGFAVMLPFDLQERYSEGDGPRAGNALSYENFAGTDEEMPLISPSFLLNGNSYRVASYRRPGCAYDFLRDLLGKEKFISVMQEYVRLWNGKHPIPYDFFFAFNKYAGEDLSWYFKLWFFEKGYPDFSLQNVKFEKGTLSFDVKKVGNIPVPLAVKIVLKDSTRKEIYETARIWKDKDLYSVKLKLEQEPLFIELGSKIIPDVNRKDNEFYFVR